MSAARVSSQACAGIMASKGKKAVVLKGKEIAGEIRAQVAAEIAQLKEKTPSFQPSLTIVQVCARL